jgi:uncharacterized phiE125 gp8 family phage protein
MLEKLEGSDQLPVSLQQVKAQLRLDHPDDDEHLVHLIKTGIAWIESYLGKGLLKQTWRQVWQGAQVGEACRERNRIYLGKAPLLNIVSVVSLSPQGDRKSVPYTLGERGGRPFILLKNTLSDTHGLEMVYQVGFGERPDDIPADIRQALLVYVSCLYESRTMIPRGDLLGIYTLLNPYRVMRLI